ncbi:hypothetical protein [Desulfobacterium sp. N47]|uniref:Uncharacterized protein n=1 Tax=uncultured Desulfobacterium sp. TaxID=201089 RepID=E1YK46_9BACT|nr:hypothetical protein N47_E51620 [uncultured Desulfobacterium sp.]
MRNYLFYTKLPVQPADVAVVLYGDEAENRENEAVRLIKNKLASNIYYPLYNRSYSVSSNNKIEEKSDTLLSIAGFNYLRKDQAIKHYENTHIELLVAKDYIRRNHFKKIIFVSSSYHMRRIKLISEELFDENVELYYSSPEQYIKGLGWLINRREIKFVFSEYAKIAWFLFYRSFMPIPI